MLAHGYDPTWLTIAGIGLVVALGVCLWLGRDDDDDLLWVAREMPELHPDDDASTGEWPAPRPDGPPPERYAAFLRRMGVEPDRERFPAPKRPRPGED